MFSYRKPSCGLDLGTTFHTGHKVDDRAALACPEVVPEVFVVTDAETGGAFLTQRRKVPTQVAVFPQGVDSPCREVRPNTDASLYFLVVHGSGFFVNLLHCSSNFQ